MLPGTFDQIRTGMPSYETRQCGRGVPTVSNVGTVALPPGPVPGLGENVNGVFQYPPALINDILKFGFPGGVPNSVPAPPCRQQGKYPPDNTLYPHLKAE